MYDISDSATNYYLVALFYFTLLLMAYLKKRAQPVIGYALYGIKKNVLISFLAFQDEAVILCERA